jgi:hypothetical protein
MATTWLNEVRAATTGSNIGLSGTQSIDGVILAPHDSVLVKDQTTASQNGTYIVQTGSWTRRDKAITPEATVRVSEGTINGHSEWYLATPAPITLGKTPLTFANVVGNWKNAVRAATTANIVLNSPGATIDGVSLNAGDRVLVKDQSTALQNGIYVFEGNASPMTRAADALSLTPEATVRVSEGLTNAHSTWCLTTQGAITVGTTALRFSPLGQYVAYVSTVLGSLRDGVLATASAAQVGSTVVFAECCTTIGDGGGGMFRWDAAGGTDDGGTIIVPGGSGIGAVGPCWRRLYSGAVNARWFGAQGDGARGDQATDDTFALQQALNFLMNTASGGKLYIPAGTYKITYTLWLIGDGSHNYVIEGDMGGETYNTQILWKGPPGCTMLDCWGINYSFFRHLTFNGNGRNLNAGAASNPAVSSTGAGCCTWFHTNEYGTVTHPGIDAVSEKSGAATFFVFFEDVSWRGVVGGLYPACAVGDGPLSPGDLTVDAQGNYTAYVVGGQMPPNLQIGQNAVDAVYSTTLTQDSLVSQTQGVGSTFNVASTTGFTLYRGLAAQNAKPSHQAWYGQITSIDQQNNVITAIDQNQLGLPFDMPAGSTVYSIFPTAVVQPESSSGVFSRILTQKTPAGQTVFKVVSATGFTVNRALIACQPGSNPWVGRITSIDQKNNVITAIDQSPNGGPYFEMPAGSTVYSVFPNAVTVPLPASAKIHALCSAISTSECAGFTWEKCTFFGGGWDTTVPYWMGSTPYAEGQIVRAYPDNGLFFACTQAGTSDTNQPTNWNLDLGGTTNESAVVWTTQVTGAAQHCYACVAVYSGYNTEQFGWRDCNVFNQGGVFGIYSPANANNEWFMENVQFSNFSGAAVNLGLNNYAKLTMYQCATESAIGFGYFVKDGGSNSGCLNMDGCEVVYNAVGNPYTSAVWSSGPTRIERCVFQHLYSDLGSSAQPLSVSIGGNSNIIIEDCAFYAEQYHGFLGRQRRLCVVFQRAAHESYTPMG